MPWQEVDTVDLRREFVQLAQQGALSLSALCRRYQISRKTGYKWLQRYAQEGDEGLHDRSRCPHHQPARSPASVEQAVLKVRQRFPEWGGRKLARVMRNEGQTKIPSPSTITQILRRHGQLHLLGESAPVNFIRFEHPHCGVISSRISGMPGIRIQNRRFVFSIDRIGGGIAKTVFC